MGLMTSLGRTVAAALAGILVSFIIEERAEIWVLIVGLLWAVDAPVRTHWVHPPTDWDRLWQTMDLLFPSLACIAAAILTSYFLRKRTRSTQAI
jgi:hypothetical protein